MIQFWLIFCPMGWTLKPKNQKSCQDCQVFSGERFIVQNSCHWEQASRGIWLYLLCFVHMFDLCKQSGKAFAKSHSAKDHLFRRLHIQQENMYSFTSLIWLFPCKIHQSSMDNLNHSKGSKLGSKIPMVSRRIHIPRYSLWHVPVCLWLIRVFNFFGWNSSGQSITGKLPPKTNCHLSWRILVYQDWFTGLKKILQWRYREWWRWDESWVSLQNVYPQLLKVWNDHTLRYARTKCLRSTTEPFQTFPAKMFIWF